MKLSERQVYVVTGSEDGIVGVFSNVKLAWEKAVRYLGTTEPIGSYPNALKSLQEYGQFTVGCAGQMSADIRCFNLNAE